MLPGIQDYYTATPSETSSTQLPIQLTSRWLFHFKTFENDSEDKVEDDKEIANYISTHEVIEAQSDGLNNLTSVKNKD